MLTPTHSILAFWFNRFLNRRLKTRISWLFIVCGAMLPDFFYATHWLLKRVGVGKDWNWEFWLNISKFLHSLPIAITAFLFFSFFVSLFLDREVYFRIKSFFYGWILFHITLDVFTHKSEGWPYFWPWLDWKINGIIDHNDLLFWILEFAVYILFFGLLSSKWLKNRTLK